MCRVGRALLRSKERRGDDVTTMTLEHHAADERPTGGALAALSLAPLGVVYGDIGTSPIYALRESLHGKHGLPPSPENVLGLSLIHISEPTRLLSISYAVFCLKKKN